MHQVANLFYLTVPLQVEDSNHAGGHKFHASLKHATHHYKPVWPACLQQTTVVACVI